MSRATKALAALAALAAAAAAAHPAAVPAPANCSRHIRVGVFDDANPLAASFLTGWIVDAARYVVDLETAKDDDPIFKQAVPTFAPGTHARRKTHHQLRLLGRSQTPDAAKDRSRTMLSLPSQSARSGTNWMKGKSFKRLSHTRSDALSPGSSPASTGSHVDPRSQHRGAFFRASVANLDA